MCAKIPVLVSNLDGPLEVIGNGSLGLSFKCEDAVDLANKLHDNDELRKFNLPGIMDAFDHSIHIEIDYINELINMKQLERNFADDETIHIPVAYSQYCTSKVLTMEFVEGTKMQDVIESNSEEFDKPLIAKRVLYETVIA